MTVPRVPSQLWYRRDITIEGRSAFRLRFNLRDGRRTYAGYLPPDSKDGVADLDAAETFAEALIKAFPLLTEPDSGWRSWNQKLPREVAIRNLGPSRYGLAAIDGRSAPYMVLSPIVFDSTPEATVRRRQATVVRELVHLLQFETLLFLHWHKAALGSDPNWWLHEAVSLSAESLVYPNRPPSYARLWEWATKPQASLESDAEGNLAAPFILYLMKRLGPSFIPRMYDTTPDQVASMRAAEVVDWHLQQHSLYLAPESMDKPSFFVDYCVDAALLGIIDTELDAGVRDIVGARATSDAFHAFPIRVAGRDMPIDHLGCRYFDLVPPKAGTDAVLAVEVSPRPEQTSSPAQNALRCELVTISKNGRNVTRTRLDLHADGRLSGSIPDFTDATVERVILVLANCAFGPGWAYNDGLQFSISAWLE